MLFFSYTVDCSIKGQIRKRFASHPFCHDKCYQSVDICPAVVIIDGCECPDGMVVNDLENKCVHPEECQGIHIVIAFSFSF